MPIEKEQKLKDIEQKIDVSVEMFKGMTSQMSILGEVASGLFEDDVDDLITELADVVAEARGEPTSFNGSGGSNIGSSSAKRYTIIFNSNETDASGNDDSSTTEQQAKVGYAVNLKSNKFKRDYYKFLGWSTDKNATTPQYKNRATFKSDEEKTIVLYAVWEPITFTLKYNANGGTGSMPNESHQVDKAFFLTKNKFTRSNYRFVGWATSSSGTKVYSDEEKIVQQRNSNLTLYAKWEQLAVSISFNANGGTGTMTTVSIKYNTTYTVPACSFTRSGYLFKGWATSSSGSVAYAVGAKITVTNAITLYAVWQKQTSTSPAIGGSTQFWYGRVNYWAASTSALLNDVNAMKSAGLTGYMIEAAIYNESAIKNFTVGDMQNASKKATYNSWLANIESKYKYLLDLCRKNGMWLFISIVNDNAVPKTGFHASFLYDIVATDIMNKIVIPNGPENVCVQPTAEVDTTKGLSWNRTAIQSLKNKNFITVNGGCNHGDRSNSAGARYMAFHPSGTSENAYCTKSTTFMVSDNSHIINELNGHKSKIIQWRNFVKNSGYPICGYYDVYNNSVNTTAINGMAGR